MLNSFFNKYSFLVSDFESDNQSSNLDFPISPLKSIISIILSKPSCEMIYCKSSGSHEPKPL